MEGPTPLRQSQLPLSRHERETTPLQPEKKTGGILGILAAIGIAIAKFFSYIKFFLLPLAKAAPLLKSGLSMFLMIGVYWAIWGWRWAVGFVVLLFVHECGHLIAAKYFGLNVGAPVFIPFMGAFIALKEAPRNAWIEAWVGIGGPLLGSAGALVCHALGEQFDAPLLIALAYTGYFLNLFNLIPVGQLDGGRIATALSPWLWLPGIGVLGWLAWHRPNFILILVLIMSLPRIFFLFRRKTEEERRYFELAPSQRFIMAVCYLGLVAALVAGMHTAQVQLHSRGVHERTRSPHVQ